MMMLMMIPVAGINATQQISRDPHQHLVLVHVQLHHLGLALIRTNGNFPAGVIYSKGKARFCFSFPLSFVYLLFISLFF